jgi:spermidine/putrescine transport system substrate-binding protein
VIIGAAFDWNGAGDAPRPAEQGHQAMAIRRKATSIFMDSAAILKDAKNVENAKLFLNFIMDPENAAMISAFARYANGIKGSESAGEFLKPCAPEVTEIYSKIWTDVLK